MVYHSVVNPTPSRPSPASRPTIVRRLSPFALALVSGAVALAANLAADTVTLSPWLSPWLVWGATGLLVVVSVAVEVTRHRTREDAAKVVASDAATETIVGRAQRLQEHLADTARLLPALQAELELRTAALDRLQVDAAHYERLAALHRDEAAAVQRLVEQTVALGLERTSRRGGRQQWLFFLLGLAFSVPLGAAGNLLYAWLVK